MVKERSKFFQLNKEFREDMIGNDYAEKCKIEGKEGRCWYLHIIVCTTHKNLEKLGWFFIVCSAQYANMSINEELMSGPDLANQESPGT